MATLSLDKQIKQYLPQLDNEEKQSLLSVIKSFLKLKETPQPVQRLTIEQYNKELEEAETRMDAGEFVSHEDAKSKLNHGSEIELEQIGFDATRKIL